MRKSKQQTMYRRKKSKVKADKSQIKPTTPGLVEWLLGKLRG